MNDYDIAPLEPGEILPPLESGSRIDAALGGRSLQQMKTTYATALQVQKPRQLAEVQRRLLEEARLGGEDFYYGWGAGKDSIEGPSVKLAMALARCWGNCAVELLPVQDTPDSWIFTAAFVDLETGFTLQRQFRQSKGWKVHGKHDEARKEDIRFQIGQSKSVRNVVLNALPASLISRAMLEAKSGVRAKIEDYVKKNGIVAAVDMLVAALAKRGVAEDRVLARCLVADKKAITVDHMVTLRGDLQAIDGGQERAEDLFPQVAAANGAAAEAGTGNGSRTQQLAEKLGVPAAPEPAAPPTPTQTDVGQKSSEKPGRKASKAQLKRLQELSRRVVSSPEQFDNLLARHQVEKAGSGLRLC